MVGDSQGSGRKYYRVVVPGRRTPRRPEVPTADRPADVYFSDLWRESGESAALRAWAVAVAESFVWLGVENRGGMAPEINCFHECWVDASLALCVRYGHRERTVGHRFSDLDVDPIVQRRLDPGAPRERSMLAGVQASNLYHGGLNGGPCAEHEWVDPLGYEWRGDTPGEGWHEAIEGPRLATVFPYP